MFADQAVFENCSIVVGHQATFGGLIANESIQVHTGIKDSPFLRL